MSKWLPFVMLTILSWGTYIPTLHRGQVALGGSGIHAFLMVGVAYVLVAIAVPGLMIARAGSWGVYSPNGMALCIGAGVLGALGALGIVLALVNGGRPTVVPPLVFAGAPVVSVFVGALGSACSWRCSITRLRTLRRRSSSSAFSWPRPAPDWCSRTVRARVLSPASRPSPAAVRLFECDLFLERRANGRRPDRRSLLVQVQAIIDEDIGHDLPGGVEERRGDVDIA